MLAIIVGLLALGTTPAKALSLLWPTSLLVGGNYSVQWSGGVIPYELDVVRLDPNTTIDTYIGDALVTYWVVNVPVGTNIVFNVTDAAGTYVQSTVLNVAANPAISRQSSFSELSTQSVASVASVSSISLLSIVSTSISAGPTSTPQSIPSDSVTGSQTTTQSPGSPNSSGSPTSADSSTSSGSPNSTGPPSSTGSPGPSSTSAGGNGGNNNGGGGGSNAGAIAGGVVGGVVGVALLAVLGFFLIRRRQQQYNYEAASQSPPTLQSFPPSASEGHDHPSMSQAQIYDAPGGVISPLSSTAPSGGLAMSDDEAYYNRVLFQQQQQRNAAGQAPTRYGGLPEV